MSKPTTPATPDVALSKLDSALLNILVKDGRASFADITRQLGVSRAHAQARVQALQSNGVIEMFGAVINPEKLGKVISTFLDIRVAPAAMERISQELVDSYETFDAFVRRHIFNRPDILSVDCKTLMTRVKNRRGGARL